MRVLIVTSKDEEIGGVAYVVGSLARYLEKEGHQVIFLYPGKAIIPKRKMNKLGFPGFELRMQRPFGERNPVISLMAFLVLFPIGMCQLIGLLCKHRIQIINIHYPRDCFYYLAICSRILRIGLINSIHGADVFPDGKPRSEYSRAFRFLLSSSDLIVVPSRRFHRDFLSVFSNLNGKGTFIYNGVDLEEFNGSSVRSSEDDQLPYILCVSAYKEQKAIDMLVRAFKRIQEAYPAVKLVIVGAGPGPLRGSLENLALFLGLQERIEFLGPQGRFEVATLLHGCQFFVLPSRVETFGIVILEAMACKKAVVATTAGGIPEIIENGKNGILVEPDNPNALAEALITLLNDRTLRQTIANNGYATVCESFRLESMVAAYQTAFGDILAAKRSKHRSSSQVSSVSIKED